MQVWSTVVLQQKDYHRQDIVLPAQKLNAQPPTENWPHRRYDVAYANTDPQQKWPRSGLSGKSMFRAARIYSGQTFRSWLVGHSVVQLRLIFCVASPRNSAPIPASNMFLVYVQRFEIVPQIFDRSGQSQRGGYPDCVSQLYVLKRSFRADGSRLGDVIPLTNLRTPADLIPRFHGKADVRLTVSSIARNSF